jgi:hypothetical protein
MELNADPRNEDPCDSSTFLIRSAGSNRNSEQTRSNRASRNLTSNMIFSCVDSSNQTGKALSKPSIIAMIITKQIFRKIEYQNIFQENRECPSLHL